MKSNQTVAKIFDYLILIKLFNSLLLFFHVIKFEINYFRKIKLKECLFFLLKKRQINYYTGKNRNIIMSKRCNVGFKIFVFLFLLKEEYYCNKKNYFFYSLEQYFDKVLKKVYLF
jgi:hypothetical protein